MECIRSKAQGGKPLADKVWEYVNAKLQNDDAFKAHAVLNYKLAYEAYIQRIDKATIDEEATIDEATNNISGDGDDNDNVNNNDDNSIDIDDDGDDNNHPDDDDDDGDGDDNNNDNEMEDDNNGNNDMPAFLKKTTTVQRPVWTRWGTILIITGHLVDNFISIRYLAEGIKIKVTLTYGN
jgi:hypothetical protein